MTNPTWAVIDVETTMKSPIGNAGTPFHPDNYVVLSGIKRGDGASFQWERNEQPVMGKVKAADGKFYVRLLVGHNIGYDIHHMRVAKTLSEEFLGTVNLWDTQLAEYLLTGQQHSYASLDELTAKYVPGAKLKNPQVTAIFESGKGADEVPMEWLKPYHAADLENTEQVFVKQFEKAQQMGMVPLITTQMDALAATIEMTFNGLKVDQQALLDGAMQLRTEVDILESQINMYGIAAGMPDFNCSSPKQLSLLLFGGAYKYKSRELVGTFKNGLSKYKNVEKFKAIESKFDPSGPVNGNGYFSTDDTVLQQLLAKAPDLYRRTLVQKIIEHREKNKQLGTYWEGLLKLVMPDGMIHHRLNHCITRTGRLSSSDPNLQNVTNGDIKKVFVSRWGDDGVIVEADFKQLEMVELAIVSGDTQLMADILGGVDMHDALFESMYGRKMRKEERKSFKRCSFALVYGAGATGIAQQSGLSKKDAKRFIETFYNRYKGVKAYHDELIEAAKLNRVPSDKRTASGKNAGQFFLKSETGRRYVFTEYDAPDFLQREGIETSFSPTELKNYPVQGGATGDKVPLCIGKLYRVLRNHPTLRDKCLLINTVHDSVMFDCHKDVLQEALTVIKRVMEATPDYYKEAFGIAMPLPLKVELSYGPNWKDQTAVDFDNSTSEWREAA